jgi:AraC-like DNA-binding protein
VGPRITLRGSAAEEQMGNYLQMSTQQQIAALLELHWSDRRIARELDLHRETVERLFEFTFSVLSL